MATTELKVICALTKNKDVSTLLAGNVDPLFQGYYGDVWDGIKQYYSKYRAIPEFDLLKTKFGDLDHVDTNAPTAFYLEELREEFVDRRIKELSMKTAADAKSGQSAKERLETLTTEFNKLSQFTNNVRDLDISDYEQAVTHYEQVKQRAAERGGTPGIPTGFKSIDSNYPTGMAPGHLICCIGWPGKAKTWFTGYLACQAYSQGYKPMIMSLEMSPENMRDRLYTMMGSGMFSAAGFSKGDVNLDDFSQFGKRHFADKGGFIVVAGEGTDDVTPGTVAAKAEQHKPDLIICDYHQLFMNDGKPLQNATERGKEVSRAFKILARNFNVPLIDITAATQSDISDRDAPPLMSQVAWSKSIEYDADLAFAVHKHEDSGLVEVVGRKNRHGGLFDFFIDWDIDRGILQEKF